MKHENNITCRLKSTINKHLSAYVARARLVKFFSATLWASIFAIIWLMTWCLVNQWYPLRKPVRLVGLIVGMIVVLAIVVNQAISLFRQYDFLAAASEIEKKWPEFDQRLITVVSEDSSESLLDHLREEVENIFDQTPSKTRVSLRPLSIPAVILVLLTIVSARLHLKQIYYPLAANSKINSTSTLASSGNVFTPTAARTCLPGSPNISTSNSLAPLATCGCCVKFASLLTNTPTRTTPAKQLTEPMID